MSLPVDARVRALLVEAETLLEKGMCREAADIFGRVLLLDRGHREARSGLERAQSLLAEGQRRTEARLEEAEAALRAGEPEISNVLETNRQSEEGELQSGPLDRLDGRASHATADSGPTQPTSKRRAAPFSRQALVAAWTAAFVTLAVGLAFSWDSLVERLVSNPEPESGSISTSTSEPDRTAGEIAVSRARELVARGDLKTALVILEEVSPQDAEYPFARRLRAQVLATLPPPRSSLWK